MQVTHEKDGSVEVSPFQGLWRTYQSPLEALLGEAKLKLGLSHKTRKGSLLDSQSRKELGIDCATLSKVRYGKLKLPQIWLLRIHVWSGLPLKDVEALANMESDVQPHHSLRKEQK